MLASISGSLEMISCRAAQGRTEGLERYIEAALTSTARAAALTHRLLAFSRRQTLDPQPTDLNRLVLGMAELFRNTVGPAIRIETRLASELHLTLCDANQLENALLNSPLTKCVFQVAVGAIPMVTTSVTYSSSMTAIMPKTTRESVRKTKMKAARASAASLGVP